MSDEKSSQESKRRPSAKTLDRHRAAIETLDARILELVARRLDEAQAIGELKGARGIPLRNFEVEAQVCARLETMAGGLGRGSELGRDLALFLIERSLETQAPILESAYAGERLKALVVGGRGGMGHWLAGFLAGQGHEVRIHDVAPGEGPWPRCEDLGDGAQWADLILVAVPMSACAQVLLAIAAHGTQAVVGEICSLKGHLLPTLERLRVGGTRVVSLHPMFGPDVRMLSGRNIVVCSEGDAGARELVKGLFASTSANLVEMSIEEHDRRMGAVLGLSHLANLAFAGALRHSGLAFEDLDAASGVTFLKQVATTRDVVRENPGLYYEIQALNAVTPETFSWIERALADFRGALERRNQGEFVALMRASGNYFAGAG